MGLFGNVSKRKARKCILDLKRRIFIRQLKMTLLLLHGRKNDHTESQDPRTINKDVNSSISTESEMFEWTSESLSGVGLQDAFAGTSGLEEVESNSESITNTFIFFGAKTSSVHLTRHARSATEAISSVTSAERGVRKDGGLKPEGQCLSEIFITSGLPGARQYLNLHSNEASSVSEYEHLMDSSTDPMTNGFESQGSMCHAPEHQTTSEQSNDEEVVLEHLALKGGSHINTTDESLSQGGEKGCSVRKNVGATISCLRDTAHATLNKHQRICLAQNHGTADGPAITQEGAPPKPIFRAKRGRQAFSSWATKRCIRSSGARTCVSRAQRGRQAFGGSATMTFFARAGRERVSGPLGWHATTCHPCSNCAEHHTAR